jgi:hypothetical protein
VDIDSTKYGFTDKLGLGGVVYFSPIGTTARR